MHRRNLAKAGLAAALAPLVRPAPAAAATFTSRGASYFTDALLTTHDGRRVRFYSDLVKEKKVVFTFISSRAPAESRKVTQNLAAAQRFFGWRVGTDIYMYSIARIGQPSGNALRVIADAAGLRRVFTSNDVPLCNTHYA